MIWRFVLASVVVAGVAAGARPALANGRAPATSSITFQQGHEQNIAVGLTFGLLLSHDGGTTWAWMCEDAIGYKGTYDPRYVYTGTGALFATTFNGLKVMRDSCTFGDTPEGSKFVSVNALGPDAFYYAASQTADAAHGVTSDFQVYKSVNDGMTFPNPTRPDDATDTNVWWESLVIAPSNPQIIYLSGYRYIPNPTGGTMRDHMVFRSDNAGTSWTPLVKTGQPAGFTLMPNSVIHIVGITRDDPRHVYARVELVDNTLSDAIFVSTDSGVSWTEIHRKTATIGAFAVRAALNGQGKHDLVIGTQAIGAEVSHNDGITWTALAGAPHLGCLVENSAGELWACTQNYGFSGVPSDEAGIMKTTDLMTWTKVLRYQDLTDAATCAAGTIQHDGCATMWCTVCMQLGCTPSASYSCPVASEAPTTIPPPGKAGCCDTGSGPGGPLALALSVATIALRPRRRRAP
jgi:hypothetical protein